MKTDFSINVQVNLGLTPEVEALIKAVLGHTTTSAALPQQEPAAKKEVKKTADAPAKAPAEAKATNGAKQETTAEAEAQAPQPPQQATPAETEAKQETPKGDPGEIARAIMEKTRKRIEGEDYKDNTTGEAYQKYHRALSGKFKSFATELGAKDKPSLLPIEKIKDFEAMCDELVILEDGTLGIVAPF